MATLGTDTFVRADNPSSWGTASDGNTYTNTGGGTETISSNHGTISNPLADANMQHGTYTSANMDVSVRITPTNTGDIFGPEARYSVSGGNISCYKFLCYGGAIHINKSVSGSGSQLTSVNFSISANQAYWMRLRTIGTTITGDIWLDGSSEGTATSTSTTDSAIASGGAALLGNTATTNVIKYDSLTVTDGSTTSSRTIPATAALQSLGLSRTVPSSVDLQSLGLSRVVPASTALLTTASRVIPATVSLSAPTSSRVIPCAAALQGTFTRSIPASVALVAVNALVYVRGGQAVAYTRGGQAALYVREE